MKRSNKVVWRKSTRSNQGANCVQVALLPDRIMVRDSKDPHGPALAVPPSEWRAFLTGITDEQLTP